MSKDMTKDEIHIREIWFPDHIATYEQQGDLKVLKWKKEGTIAYSIRYVFDGHRMYVTGDLGEALFCFTETADVHIQSDYGLDYFESKLRAYDGERRDFNSDNAVRALREWLKRIKDRDIEYDHDEMREFFDRARNCSSTDDWAHVVNSTDFISNLDCDYWEWMYSIGDEMPMRIQSYLIGLKMAFERMKLSVTA